MIYLDYQATTPLAPEAREAMLPYLNGKFGNPHSSHRMGREAAAAVEVARDKIASLLPSGGSLAFTGGATEALNWAIKGSAGAIVTVATEHAAVLDTVGAVARSGREVHILPVDAQGEIDLETAAAVIQPGVGLVAAMLVNNEIGVINPVAALAKLSRRAGALFLCDAVQGYGRVAIPDTCDMIALSAHKIHGPKGIGALWLRDGITLEPLLHGGSQEAAGRSGTLSPALCAGFGAAAQMMIEREDEDSAHIERLWEIATGRLGSEWAINGSVAERYRGNLNIRHEGVDAARMISNLRNVAISAGSACASGAGRPSHVLKALGLSDRQSRGSIRIGFGRYTAAEEIESAMTMILDEADRQRMKAA